MDKPSVTTICKSISGGDEIWKRFVDSHNGQSFCLTGTGVYFRAVPHIFISFFLFSPPSPSLFFNPSLSLSPSSSLPLFRPPYLSLYSMLCSLECIQEHAVVVLMNALSMLPVKGWGEEEEISSIWDAVITIVTSNSGACSCVLCICKYTWFFYLAAFYLLCSDEVSLQVCPEDLMKASLSVLTLISEGLLASSPV